jgi:hypothetical protein
LIWFDVFEDSKRTKETDTFLLDYNWIYSAENNARHLVGLQ